MSEAATGFTLSPLKDEVGEKNQTGQQEAFSNLEQRSEQSYFQCSWELQHNSVITLLSHRGVMGDGMEHNHAQVTRAVTRARCAEGT